ncbi:hypothetical protein DM02DRAFT_624681 [Periconia macrospinosa]|uniref:ADP-ribosylation n=1 Tax=Periconia macrospinosa TaxID=97972 RepID=A0A2V1E6J6_9PLEO|nr:hypothetical protein DM02DRAFT_624681 [Periconia macrospinosa]
MQILTLLSTILLALLAITSIANPIAIRNGDLGAEVAVLDTRAKKTSAASPKVPTKTTAKVSSTATRKQSATSIQKTTASRTASPTPAIKLATIADCKAQMTVGKDTTLFYSVVRSQVARDTIEKYPYLKNYVTLRSRWKNPKWPDQFTVGVSDTTAKKFWDTASQALAEMSSGTAYVLLPAGKGTEWKKGTVWDRVEWPNLPKGLKVIRINPDDPNAQEVIRAG